MSLDTLLEAAEYLEWRSNTKAREETQQFHPYAKQAPPSSEEKSTDSNHVESGTDEAKEKRRAGGAGTREVHNKLEKNRRKHLKECFETLKAEIPNMDDKKTSNLSILRSAFRYIQALRRREREFEQEMQRLARAKITAQERICGLKRDLSQMNIEIDLNHWMSSQDRDSDSTSTATGGGSPIMSEDEETEGGRGPPSSSTTDSITRPSEFQVMKTILSTPVTSTVATTTQQISFKPPVTQILHQTITQRAALQAQAKLQQQQQQQAQQQLQQQQQIHLTPQMMAVQANSLRPVAHPAMRQMAQLRHIMVTQVMTPTVFNPTAFTSMANPLSLVAAAAANSAPAPTGFVTTGPAATSNTPVSAVVNRLVPPHYSQGTALVTVPTTTTGSTTTAAPTPAMVTTTAMVSTPTMAAAPLAQITAMKHIIPAPLTQGLTPAQLLSPASHMSAISHLVSQTAVPRTTAGQVPAAGLQGAQIVPPGAGVHPVISSLGQMTPVTQIMPPMTIMSTGLPPGLTQAQFTSLMNQQMSKPLGQIPIIPQPFLQPTQMVRQQMVKPVVVANVVTTTAPPVQVTVPVTHTA